MTSRFDVRVFILRTPQLLIQMRPAANSIRQARESTDVCHDNQHDLGAHNYYYKCHVSCL